MTIRQSRRDIRAYVGWNKPVLVEALRNVQTICPPRVSKQAKADLERIVRGALERDDNDPIRLAMQRALTDARATL